MKNFKFIILGAVLLLGLNSNAQTDSTLVEINDQIWTPFSEAFKNLDFELFNSLHHPDFIRINGNQDIIRSRDAYLRGYQENWQDETRNIEIEFRFLERINSENKASERGIYKFTVNPNSNDEASYYGKFHVVMIKINDSWKLLVDYDSHENNTIDQESFNNAMAINDFSKK